MPSVTIPFVGSFNLPLIPPNASDGGSIIYKGQRFANCVFNRTINEATRTQNVSVEKRPGMFRASTYGTEDGSANLCPSFNTSAYIVAVGETNSTIRAVVSVANTAAPDTGAISAGDITGVARHIVEGLYSGIGYACITSSDGTGWFYAMNAGTGSPTFTANRTSGSPTLTSVSSFTGLYVGQALSGTGIPANARIQSMNVGGATITMGTDSATAANATSGSGTSTTITRTPIAKIIDVDFPSCVGAFAFLDGYAFVMTATARIYQSALNSIESWGASDYITASMAPDNGVGCVRYKNQILAFGNDSGELFYNAGNPSGSVLSRSEQAFFRIGAIGSIGITVAEDTVYWVGASTSGGLAVYVLNGFTPVKISTAEVDSILNSAYQQGYTSIDLAAVRVAGRIQLFLTSKETSLDGNVLPTSLLFDTDLSIWHLWQGAEADVSFRKPAFNLYRDCVVFVGLNGAIFFCYFGDIAYFRDNTTTGSDGTAYSMQITTRKMNFGTNNLKTLTRMQLNCDQYASGSVTCNTSDTDASYSGGFTGASGTFDVTTPNPQIHRMGAFTGGRIFNFTHSTAAAFRAESVAFDYTIGRH